MSKYDYLIVGSGLFGSVFAREAARSGRRVLVLEKRSAVGGNVATALIHGVRVHLHGPHIFHTASKVIWDYVNNFTEFWPYRHKVKALYQDQIYSLPFNMQTYYEMWGVVTPEEAREELARQKIPVKNPRNLEEWALANIGRDLYEFFIYGYTKKQWMREPQELPVSIIRRLPIRFSYDDNYYKHLYQGIPIKGYSCLIENLLQGVETKTGEDFFDLRDWRSIANKLVYSGSIDEYFDYELGCLEYRGLSFDQVVVPANHQGCPQMNYTEEKVPYTRIIEHGHFNPNWEPSLDDMSIITYEYPIEWQPGFERYYPVNDDKNNALYAQYKAKIKEQSDVLVGGRLGFYKYMDMDTTVAQALSFVKREINPK